MRAMSEAQRSWGFRDRTDDGYANSVIVEMKEEVDKTFVKRWLHDIPGQDGMTEAEKVAPPTEGRKRRPTVLMSAFFM